MAEQKPFIPCRTCASKRGPKPGYYFVKTSQDSRNYLAVQECACHKAWAQTKVHYYKALESGIWPQSLDYDIGDYIGTKSLDNIDRLKKYVAGFTNDFGSTMVYLHGPNGTQKTTLAHWIGAQVIMQGKTVRYVLMQNLLSLMSSNVFENDEEKLRNLNELRSVDLLIVDESFSKDKVTIYESGYQLPFLDRFLRERFEMNQKGIVFVSNKKPDEIESQKFSKSIQDLVVRNTTAVGTSLEFVDNYVRERSHFAVKGLFD